MCPTPTPLCPIASDSVARLLEDLEATDARTALGRVRTEEFIPDIKQHAALDGYTRFELVSTEEALVVLILWLPGQFSPAHDHGGSSCVFRILKGVGTEQRFEALNRQSAVMVEEDRFLPGSIVSCDGEDIHALGNEAAAAEALVTLHVYRPRPMMHQYQIVPGKIA